MWRQALQIHASQGKPGTPARLKAGMTSRVFSSALLCLAVLAAPALAQPAAGSAAPVQEPPKRVSKGEKQALKWFGMLDTNKDGRISRDEAKVAFRLSPAIADYFRDADLNGDGYLTQQEIRTVAERRRIERELKRQREQQDPSSSATLANGQSAAPTTATSR